MNIKKIYENKKYPNTKELPDGTTIEKCRYGWIYYKGEVKRNERR